MCLAVCVCVCASVRQRDRERERKMQVNPETGSESCVFTLSGAVTSLWLHSCTQVTYMRLQTHTHVRAPMQFGTKHPECDIISGSITHCNQQVFWVLMCD